MSSDELIYDSAGVQVTRSLVRLPNQTLSTSAISSVSFGKSRPILWPPLGVTGLGVIFLIFSAEIGVGAFALLTLLALAWLAWDRMRDRPFYVVLMTDGGDVRAMETKFEDEARSLVEAIEKAITCSPER